LAVNETEMLWRRETGRVSSGEHYVEGGSPNSVVVRELDTPWVSTVLYTDFHPEGKIENPSADELAKLAIQSVATADEGKDGISYLMNAIACGNETPLTPSYRDEILRRTNAMSLEEALRNTKGTLAAK
jgi:hypothetical protein